MDTTTLSRTAKRTTLCLSAMLGTVGSAALAGPARPAGCVIEPDQIADVGSPVTGIIDKLNVSLGDSVQAGQALVMLHADVERANATAATLRSQMDAEVKAAAANLELARQKVQRTQQLVAQDFMSKEALDEARTEMDVATQKHAQARNQQRLYAQEQAMTQAQLSLRTLRSPIAGIVVERYNNVGERVEDRPVLRIASIDPLRVSLMVPIAQYGQVAVGANLTIRPDLPGAAPVQATVQYVDKVVDAASNTFRVRLTLPNANNRLPAGLRCKADWPTGVALSATQPAIPPAVKTIAQTSQPTSWLKMSMAMAALPAQAIRRTTPSTTLPTISAPIRLKSSYLLADAR